MMTAPEPILLIAHRDKEVLDHLRVLFLANGYGVSSASTGQEALDRFYSSPPQAMLIEHGMEAPSGAPLPNEFKSDNFYGHIPCLLLMERVTVTPQLDWANLPADDFVMEPFDPDEILARVNLALARCQRDVNANPLTGLPGNLTISREAERRILASMPFAFAYLDIDHFKAYNDKYGFARGDEVLRMTARLLVNAIRAHGGHDTYVGHIGGDDFVWITAPDPMDEACRQVTRHFDLIVRSFYDAEDRDKGWIQSKDRQGNPATFPLMSISIGVVDTSVNAVTHVGELFSRVTEVKAYTKTLPGSAYVIDRRVK